MNTVKLRHAMLGKTGLPIASLADIADMPLKSARRAMEQLLSTGMAETCGSKKKGTGVSYLYRLTNVGASKGFH